jgi:hypothetical protein
MVAAFFVTALRRKPLRKSKLSFKSSIRTEDTHVIQPVAPISPLVEQKSGDGITRVKDANGRMIGVKPLKAIDMFRLTRAMGDDASNAALFRQAMVAVAAVEIDGEPLARPLNMMTIEALIIRLDFAGFVAVSSAIGSAEEPVNTEAVKI